MTEQSKGIRTQHPDYMRMGPMWEMCEDASDGERAVHDKRETYLPKLIGESAAAYKARLQRTPFFNATWRTISGMKGMLFRNAPKIEVPSAVQPYLEDVDMAGTPFALFAQECAEDILEVGRIGLLVDHPPMPVNEDGTPLTQAQAERLGLRPMVQRYDADCIINWKSDRINNVMQMVLVVLKEEAPISTDPYSHKTETRYRELALTPAGYRQRLFRINDKDQDEQVGDDIIPLVNGKPLPFIPFTFIGTDDLSPDVELPPLFDLVTMNFHHYRVSADYEHGCHFSGLPTPVISGYNAEEGEKLYIGGEAIITLRDPHATAAYMEIQGEFEALRKNKEDKKAEMAVLGARMLEEKTASVESDATLRTRSQGEQSQLAAMAHVLSMGLTKVLGWMAEWAGAAGNVSVEINREFVPVGLTAQELTALVGAWQSGMPGTSDENVYRLMQKREMADPEVPFEVEQERLASRGPRGNAGLLGA